MTLTAEERKQRPLAKGVLDYFPDALMEVAHASYVGNEQHNPGQPLHWAKGKSTDEADALLRHLKDRGTLDTDGVRHSAKVAWRALANLQREIEAERDAAGMLTEDVTGDGLVQMLVDDSQMALATQVEANINGLSDYVKDKLTGYEGDARLIDHGSDNGELPAPHGSRASHYEGDFGKLQEDPDAEDGFMGYRP